MSLIQPNYIYKAAVVNVVDGDTVDADIDTGFHLTSRQRLRLARVNTAEMNSRDAGERMKAQMAKASVILYVWGKTVALQTTKTDGFGRYLAEVWYLDADGNQQNLSDTLLAEGAPAYIRNS